MPGSVERGGQETVSLSRVSTFQDNELCSGAADSSSKTLQMRLIPLKQTQTQAWWQILYQVHFNTKQNRVKTTV